MKKFTTFISLCLALLVAGLPVLAADVPPNQATAQPKETHVDFGWFLYKFFNDRAFQLQRVQFPLKKERLRLGEGTVIEHIAKTDWQHLSGPSMYHCKLDCFQTVIYDNFRRQMRNSGERVLSYEGLGNGILESLYFRLIDGKWMLVRWDDTSG